MWTKHILIWFVWFEANTQSLVRQYRLVSCHKWISNIQCNFFILCEKNKSRIIVIVIYVDDVIVTGNSDVNIFHLKKLLKQKFEMKDLGKLCYFLSIEVIKSLKGISLLQKKYALNKLFKYGMMGYKPISIPLEQNVKLSVVEGDFVEDTSMSKHIVGSLIYMTIIRPNLRCVVGVVNQFM